MLVSQIANPISINEAMQMNAIVLAFIGDAVQTLEVRTRLALNSDFKTGELHRQASRELKATAQSALADKLLPHLTQDELSIYQRARNAKTKTAAKNADLCDYKKATAIEAVIGFLYVTGQVGRLEQLAF